MRIQARARAIVASEQGAIRASDLLSERQDLDTSGLGMFFTVARGNAWYSVFGHLEGTERFVPVYAYRAPVEFSEEMESLPVGELPASFDGLARAVSAATERTFKAHGRRQMNPVVFEDSEGITVYVMQGMTDPERFLLGGDFRFRFSLDGRTVREEVALHQGMIPVDMSEDAEGNHPTSSVHTHVLIAGPLETELAMVMLYPQLGTVCVGAHGQTAIYCMRPDGTIRALSLKRKEVLRELRGDGTFGSSEATSSPVDL
ncbi:hypothetical protein JGU66_18345 [Myxococcaceae bacterium JPH2]|nr:hypothetical protein [Myxococcaceae bacterium JPH2]